LGDASYSRQPDRWKVRDLELAAFALAMPVLLVSFGFFLMANTWLRLPLAQVQTWMFVMLVFTDQANVYLVCERRYFWKSAPSMWMVVIGTLADVVIVSILATLGILMEAIPVWMVAATLLVVLVYIPLADW